LSELFFFACAKKSNQKKAHPAFAPRPLRGRGPLGRRDFSTIPVLSKNSHIHVRRPADFPRRPRRYGREPEKRKSNGKSKDKSPSPQPLSRRERGTAKALLKGKKL